MPVQVLLWQSTSFGEWWFLVNRCKAKGLIFPRHFYQHIPENEAFHCGFPGIKSPAQKGWSGLSVGVWQYHQYPVRICYLVSFKYALYIYTFSQQADGGMLKIMKPVNSVHICLLDHCFPKLWISRRRDFSFHPLSWLLWRKSLRTWQGTERLTSRSTRKEKEEGEAAAEAYIIVAWLYTVLCNL